MVLSRDLVQCIAVPRPDSAARKIGNGVNTSKYHIGLVAGDDLRQLTIWQI